MAEPQICPECGLDDIGVTLAGKLRSHKTPASFDETRPKCPGSGVAVTQLPPEAPECDDTPRPPANSAICSRTSATGDLPPETPHPTTGTRTATTGGSPPLSSGQTPAPDRQTIPGADSYVDELADARRAQALDELREFPAPTFNQPLPPPPVEQPPLFDQPSASGRRAAKVLGETKPMTPFGAEIAARLKEMFHGYSNRMERSQQPTLGPSEIGTGCDRRIALSLLRYPTVNPGGDNWASFVGTCGHSGLEEMFVWADAGSGRYAAEVRLKFPSEHVPKGTTDLVDRQLQAAMDHKFMGQFSLDKLKREGPSRTYRIQLHTYAYGLTMLGEKIKRVVLIAWPRDKGNLDDLYVWEEEYDPKIARDALKRVDGIASRVLVEGGEREAYSLEFDNSECRYCPFLRKNSPTSEGGHCNGRA